MTTIVGIKTKEGVVLGSDRRASKGFFIGSKITPKIVNIDDALAVAIAGQLSLMNYKQISNEGDAFGRGELR